MESQAVGSRLISLTNHRRNLEHFSTISRGKSNFKPPHKTNNVWTATLPPASYIKFSRASVSATAAAQPSSNDPGKFNATKRDKDWIHYVGVGGCRMSALGPQTSAYSLLSKKQRAKKSDASDGINLSPKFDLCSNRTTTHGISNFNEWRASSICSNAHGGSDYKLTVVNKLLVQISADPDCETVILTVGAGNVTTVGPKLLHELQKLI